MYSSYPWCVHLVFCCGTNKLKYDCAGIIKFVNSQEPEGEYTSANQKGNSLCHNHCALTRIAHEGRYLWTIQVTFDGMLETYWQHFTMLVTLDFYVLKSVLIIGCLIKVARAGSTLWKVYHVEGVAGFCRGCYISVKSVADNSCSSPTSRWFTGSFSI